MIRVEDVAAPLALLASAFDRAISKVGIEAYRRALDDLTVAEIELATDKALKTCRFMPAPAELRELVGRKYEPASAAIVAWQAVRRAVDVHDYLVATIDFGPLVNATIRNLGGWDTICRASLSELDNPGWLRKRFGEVFVALAGIPVSSLHGDPLEGNLPRDYRGAAHVVVSIADEKRAPRIAARVETPATKGIGALVRELAEAKS